MGWVGSSYDLRKYRRRADPQPPTTNHQPSTACTCFVHCSSYDLKMVQWSSSSAYRTVINHSELGLCKGDKSIHGKHRGMWHATDNGPKAARPQVAMMADGNIVTRASIRVIPHLGEPLLVRVPPDVPADVTIVDLKVWGRDEGGGGEGRVHQKGRRQGKDRAGLWLQMNRKLAGRRAWI